MITKKSVPTIDQPILFAVVDPDAPIPHRVRVATASRALRDFVVPVLGIRGLSEPPAAAAGERRSEPRLKVA
jgi:hypothetical protein